MTISVSKQMSDILDEVWQSDLSREDAARKACETVDIQVGAAFAAIDLCRTILALPKKIDSNLSGALVYFEDGGVAKIDHIDQSSHDAADCVYGYLDKALSFGVNHSHRRLWRGVYRREFFLLIAEMQYARDHVDSLIYLPGFERSQRLGAAADEFRVDVEQFIFLASHIRKLLLKVE